MLFLGEVEFSTLGRQPSAMIESQKGKLLMYPSLLPEHWRSKNFAAQTGAGENSTAQKADVDNSDAQFEKQWMQPQAVLHPNRSIKPALSTWLLWLANSIAKEEAPVSNLWSAC